MTFFAIIVIIIHAANQRVNYAAFKSARCLGYGILPISSIWVFGQHLVLLYLLEYDDTHYKVSYSNHLITAAYQ